MSTESNKCSIEDCSWEVCQAKSDLPEAQITLPHNFLIDTHIDRVIAEAEGTCPIPDCDWQPCVTGSTSGLAGQISMNHDKTSSDAG